jgi:hypothetical protein
MAATIQILDDSEEAITSVNFGAIDGGDSDQLKFYAKNAGSDAATGASLELERAAGSDGVDNCLLALDSGGNPGTYSAGPISLGTIAAGAQVAFWVKVTPPNGTTPAGNPRQFDFKVRYSGV